MMLNDSEYVKYEPLGLASLVRAGDVTSTELLDLAIARVERFNPTINAVVTTMVDEARAQISQAGNNRGPFAGVPFLLKDLRAAYKGVRSSIGNAFMSTVPDFDSVITT
jgi:amidase